MVKHKQHPDNTLPLVARFWTFYRGAWVKVTVREGDGLSYGFSESTDEGWHAEGAEYWIERRDGDGRWCLWRELWSDGADCDGRVSNTLLQFCELDRLKAWAPPPGYAPPGGRSPDWQDAERAYRDYQAEAAGY